MFWLRVSASASLPGWLWLDGPVALDCAKMRMGRYSAFARSPSTLLATAAVGAVLALAAAAPLARSDARPLTIPVAEIKAGMKGYGLTVFRGTEPERFDVEVIGILQGFRPGQPLILIKTPNPRLDIVKTVRGMSGSPIYLDGRLAGAYSYSLAQFETEPVAGVTPIDLMLTEMRRPIPPGFWPLERRGPRLSHEPRAATTAESPGASTRFEGAPGRYDIEEHARQLAARFGAGGAAGGFIPAATPLMLSGFSDKAASTLRGLVEPLGLEPLQGGGGASYDPKAPSHFVNGGGLGVQLTRGDASAMALGTATYVDGAGTIAGFGHPMLNGGAEALPTCIGSVLWIDASAAASHKIGECARSLGTLVQDRPSAIVVDERVVAPVIPFEVDISGVVGAPRTHWHFEVADDKFMASGLALGAIESLIESTTSERREMTWRLRSQVTVGGHGRVDLEDVGLGTPDGQDLGHSKLGQTLGDVLNNPWEHPRIEKVDVRLDVTYALEVWRLRGVEVLDAVVDAGEKARLRLHLMPEYGPEITRVVEVTLPRELAGKDVDLEIIPGWEVIPELAPPESLDELLANEPRQNLAPRTMVVQFRVPSQGIAYRGHVTQRLPAFTVDALRPANDSTGPEFFSSWARTVLPVDFLVEGRDKVKVKVRSVLR
jgi:hypothetical protein